MSLNPQIDGQINGRDEQRNNDQEKVIGYGKRAKRLLFSKVKKVKKRLQRNKTLKNENLGFCCWCVGGLPSRDSATESPTSDPNDSGFGFDSLRGLIEKSDFLLDECNTHLDVYSSDGKDDDSYDDDGY
ncbi:hypothetical protein HanRHA438_Chr16g0761521 [Helianthus annuus]|nr:hypothetical protein HanRHA438_Chr16g0761521 [Helianthus annuus]